MTLNAASYLLIEKSERQAHLELSESCYERGGNSTNHRGVLAQYMNTPIYGRPAQLCHACHNALCSNPRHLYWGSARENMQDAMANGYRPQDVWSAMVTKYGLEEAKRITRENGSKGWSKGGKAGQGKPKSDLHKLRLSLSQKNRHKRADSPMEEAPDLNLG